MRANEAFDSTQLNSTWETAILESVELTSDKVALELLP